ncbi:hypothetical protein Tco_1019471 [Tanacetum coccineum]|uniref:Uncharacterized protein n=1 Tax=Tanacetum coccineum TaxID=301880 RepID=A0ABQ5FXH5_9ASTR
MLGIQKPSGDKMGIGYNKNEASTSEIKQVKFVKSTETGSTKDSSHKDGDGFLKDKEFVAPSTAKDKTMSNLNSKPKYLVVNKVRVPIATEKEHIGSSGYGVLVFISSWLLVKSRHRYAVSSCWIRQNKDVENTNAEINALAEITEAEERAARRNVVERVLEEAKRTTIYN